MADERRLEVAIEGLSVFARHGVHAAEQDLGQRFVLDIALVPRSSAAATSDDLADAVDYGAVAVRAAEVASGGPYRLLERLADAVCEAILAGFAVDEVRVRVAKPAAPVPLMLDTVAVTLTRRRVAP